MKKLIIALFFPLTIFASGKLQVKSGYSLETDKVAPQVGIAIYEKLLGKSFYRQWSGLGLQPRLGEDHVLYMVSEHALGVHMGDMTLSGGVKLQRASQDVIGINSDVVPFLSIETKLW